MGARPLSLHLDDDVRRELENEARLREVPESEVVKEALRDFLGRQAWMRKEIEEAVREADKGVFISEEAMTRWVDSWGTDAELPPPEPDILPPPRNR